MEKKDIEELLNKYFKTLEEQKTEEELKNSDLDKTSKQIDELKYKLDDNIEFRTELLAALETSNYNTQLNNNLLFFTIVVSGTIFICALAYKTLKFFY